MGTTFQQSSSLSVIVPLYNEEDNVRLLHEGIKLVLEEQDGIYEILYVDDGSTDSTFLRLHHFTATDQSVRIIRLCRNFGQTAAISAGIAHSTGGILVFMYGDLQNDPVDIPRNWMKGMTL